MSVAAIVPAAGASRRFRGTTAKPFAPVAGRPLLAHTLGALQRSPAIRWIIIVVRADDRTRVRALLKRFGITKALSPCLGGASRAESVANGFSALPDGARWVLVHDAARPCVSDRLLAASIDAARRYGAVACGLPATATVKAVDDARRVRVTLERDHLWCVQTPQAFRRDWFAQALARAGGRWERFPDDAAMVEAAAFPVQMIPGDPLNLKVTTREDLLLVEAVLTARPPAAHRTAR